MGHQPAGRRTLVVVAVRNEDPSWERLLGADQVTVRGPHGGHPAPHCNDIIRTEGGLPSPKDGDVTLEVPETLSSLSER